APQGIRLAVCPVDADDAGPLREPGRVLEEPGPLPSIRYGQGYVRLARQDHAPHGGRGHPRRRDALPATGLAEPPEREAVADAMPSAPAAQVAVRSGRGLGRQPGGAQGAHRRLPRPGGGPRRYTVIAAQPAGGLGRLPAEQQAVDPELLGEA
ncbi:hypothetical protein VM98_33340, partial [Streptomyces rubellomurinus subsp. indigoferus]